ncbi:hypothetical protein pipiens_015905 [Culex pipiens pipiens]|uniref:Uncharacterized protein n=1 Tax=Culex pipiens pipiens TaxID=38569 RepID=A0ABD1CNG8_CULPP
MDRRKLNVIVSVKNIASAGNVLLVMIACLTVFARHGYSRTTTRAATSSQFGPKTLMTRKRALSPGSKLVSSSNSLLKMPAREEVIGATGESGPGAIRYLDTPDKSFSDRKQYR